MKLSIIAVVIDNLNETMRFISSIKDHTKVKYELIIVDNQSTDQETINYIKEQADTYFRFDTRVCLSKAWNKGIELAKGEYVAVVNNDTVVPPNWFPPLKEVFETKEKVGMVSPLTYWNLGYNFKMKRLTTLEKPFKLEQRRQGVWGEFMLFTKKILQEIKFDESYEKASGEDLEMLYRLHEKGLGVYIQPSVFVFHQGSATGNKIYSKKEKDEIYGKNWKQFLAKWKKYEGFIHDSDM